jgi:PhnB protein
MAKLSPYLQFDGNAREAMNFYKDCLGGELELQTIAETPMAAQMPPEAQQHIMHSTLTTASFVLMGSDMVGPEGAKAGSNLTLTLICDNEAEINDLFTKLSAGGQVTHELKTEFWGDIYGDLTDQYGFRWALNCTKPAQA